MNWLHVGVWAVFWMTMFTLGGRMFDLLYLRRPGKGRHSR